MKYRFFLSAFFFALTLTPQTSFAEYRVFVLKIFRADSPQAFRLVESTLDPEQYRLYYHVEPSEQVTYIDTWRCYGRTSDFVPHCPNPKGQIPANDSPTP